MADDYIQTANVLMVVSDCQRAVDAKSGNDLLDQKLERALRINNQGCGDDILLVCTKADTLDWRTVMNEDSTLRPALDSIKNDIAAKEKEGRNTRKTMEALKRDKVARKGTLSAEEVTAMKEKIKFIEERQ